LCWIGNIKCTNCNSSDEHIEKFRPKTELPAFFSGQENEDFAEESLEPTGKETSLEEELHYSTAHRWSHSDDFFFSEAENEANAVSLLYLCISASTFSSSILFPHLHPLSTLPLLFTSYERTE
jgi:hypothetical protein